VFSVLGFCSMCSVRPCPALCPREIWGNTNVTLQLVILSAPTKKQYSPHFLPVEKPHAGTQT
jgi:hypothetical protein